MNIRYLSFEYFKGYALFLLGSSLDELTRLDIERSKELQIPILKYFSKLSQDILFDISRNAIKDYLSSIATGNAIEFIRETNQQWKNDTMAGVSKNQVEAADITLIYNIRKFSLRKLLPKYTTDLDTAIKILDEIENYFTFQQELSISTLFEISQEQIATQRNKLQHALELAKLGYWEFNRSTKEIQWSKELYLLFGIENNKEINAEIIQNHIFGEDIPLFREMNGLFFKGDSFTQEYRIRHTKGEIRYILDKAYAETNQFGDVIIKGISQDVTERKILEMEAQEANQVIEEKQELLLEAQMALQKALSESEDRFRVIADHIPNLAWMANADGHIFWYNKAWYDFTGTDIKALEGWGWQSVHHPDHLADVIKRWVFSIESGLPFEMVFPLKASNGNFHPFLTRVNPILDDEGNIMRWFGTNTDITNEIKITEELKHKNQELEKINKDLDNFIYTASHDLKAPISNIEGLVYTMKEALFEENIDKADVMILVDYIETSIVKFKITISDLTEISKLQKGDNEVEDLILEDLIKDVELSISELIKSSQSTFKLNLEVSELSFVRPYIKSILYNLIINAIKYRHPERNPLITINSYRKGGLLILEIKDNGIGIANEHFDKLFSMFKRFHNHVEGSGVGLYIVKRLIDNAGGKIEVESTLGIGTTFRIYLNS